MIDIYEIRPPVYKRVDAKDVRTDRDYLVRKLDANNRTVATVRIRVNDIRGLEHFEQTVGRHLTCLAMAGEYRKTDPKNKQSLGLDLFA